MRDEFYFPSKDGNTEIHTIGWKPEGEVKAVLQLCHGMVEYIRRYDELWWGTIIWGMENPFRVSQSMGFLMRNMVMPA